MPYRHLQSIDLDPGTPIANAVRRAADAAALGDAEELDTACGTAVDLAASGSRELWLTLATDHVAQLVDLTSVCLALTRCDQYLLQAGQHGDSLRALRARILATDSDSDTLTERLHRATSLRQKGRHEEAVEALARAVGADGDPAWQLIVLWEFVEVLRVLRRDTDEADDPANVDLTESGDQASRFASRIQHARRLVSNDRLREATNLLISLRPQVTSNVDLGFWHLAVGELSTKRLALADNDRLALPDVIGHLIEAARHAARDTLVEIRIHTLRLLGQLSFDREDHDLATECRTEATRLEEQLASRHVDDDLRVQLLQPIATEHDERIQTAAGNADTPDNKTIATIAVALEVARGSTLIEHLLPLAQGGRADLPDSSDPETCLRWVEEITDRLPRSQIVWMAHATPDRVHHVLLGRGLFRHRWVPATRGDLTRAVDELAQCWPASSATADHRADSRETWDAFDLKMEQLADALGIHTVISALPQRTRRIAVTACGTLAGIPLAAIPLPGGTHLGLRFALSDLPCLSALLPLRRRARSMRRGPSLLVRPLSDATVPWYARTNARPVLEGGESSIGRLWTYLEQRPYTCVRVDSRGHHDYRDASQSWLQLTPDSQDDGRLTPRQLWSMNLRNCGVIAIPVGESGMATRIGREERLGFARAAIHAGAASVLAARWPVEDPVAHYVLDRFEWYARYLPRDVALLRARLDLRGQAPGSPVNFPGSSHPTRWAGWTLYGDTGWHPGTHPLGRASHALLAWWRQRFGNRP